MMDLSTIVPVLLLASVTSSKCISTTNYRQDKTTSFSDILKPPPPPPPLNIRPVPFHGGKNRLQRQNFEGYHYPPPPPLPLPPAPPEPYLKLPAPFYKQYNFNYVKAPQPFTTTPNPGLFQKISTWLFPPPQSPNGPGQYQNPQISNGQIKKDCNPCNLVPWIPVIKYNPPSSLSAISPTYGLPSPTYTVPLEKIPVPFNSPHPIYGPPNFQTSTNSELAPPTTTYSYPVSTYDLPSSTYETPIATYIQSNPSTDYSTQTAYPPTSQGFGLSYSSGHNSIETGKPQNFEEIRLPKVFPPSGFRNSYGEPIANNYNFGDLYPATAAESSKLKPEIRPPENTIVQNAATNSTISLSKPQPFTNHRGRNIHTLQPVALPNLSVSPLPPIYNARPFRPSVPANDFQVVSSVPLAQITSFEYTPNVVQSPILDVNGRRHNQTKSFRKIPYTNQENKNVAIDNFSSQSNTIQESSFETTGPGASSEVFRPGIEQAGKQTHNIVPSNHKPQFADLSGMNDEELDKYRNENNLQSIDSPLLYLKPNTPHKEFQSFVLHISTPAPQSNEYEIYDDDLSVNGTPIPEDIYRITSSPQDYQSTSSPINQDKPKIVQIIIPYTTGNNQVDEVADFNSNFNINNNWAPGNFNSESQGRKVPSNTEQYFSSTPGYSEHYSSSTPSYGLSTEHEHVTQYYQTPKLSTSAILNDLYDVKEAPFDIIKLQNTIDGWTEQEYSKHHKKQPKQHSVEKYAHAKKIPDEFFTTVSPLVSLYASPSFSNNFYDHESADTVQHIYKDPTTTESSNTHKNIQKDVKNYQRMNHIEEDKRPQVYTAASSFRSTTTTQAPWSEVLTSISPLTKEKIYVVTARPWRESNSTYLERLKGEPFDSKRPRALDNDVSASGVLPFKSPRFMNRPAISNFYRGDPEVMWTDTSFDLGSSWHRSINNLESKHETAEPVAEPLTNTTPATEEADVNSKTIMADEERFDAVTAVTSNTSITN